MFVCEAFERHYVFGARGVALAGLPALPQPGEGGQHSLHRTYQPKEIEA